MWKKVGNIKGKKGEDGRTIEIVRSNGYIAWKYKDSNELTNLISFEELRGAPGIVTTRIETKEGEPGKDAAEIREIIANPEGELIFKMEDGRVINAGKLPAGGPAKRWGGGGTTKVYVDAAILAATTNMTVANFASPNVSQWTNDAGYLTSSTLSVTWGSITGTLSNQTDLQAALNAKQATGNYITALTGDITASGPGSVAATLATVNSNVGSFGSSTAIPSFTVNGKGLITAASTNVVVAPAGTLTGTTLASNIVTSSLTTIGTLIAGGVSFSLVTGIVPLNQGGTNANLTASNGGIFYSTSSAGAILSGTATANKMLLSGATATPTWSTSTIPSSSGATANKVLLSDGTNYVLSTPTFPNASATSGKVTISDGTNWIASTSIFPNTVGTAGKIIRSDGTVNAYTTATFSDTYTASNILYSNGSNTVTGLATANDGVLITSGAGVPSISSTLPNAVQDLITRLSTIVSGIWNAGAITSSGTISSTVSASSSLVQSIYSNAIGTNHSRMLAETQSFAAASNAYSEWRSSSVGTGWVAGYYSNGGAGNFNLCTGTDVGANAKMTITQAGAVSFSAGLSIATNGFTTGQLLEPINAQSGTTYTLALSDGGKRITFDSAAAVTVTIPKSATVATPDGFWCDLENIGSGDVIVVRETTSTEQYIGNTLIATGATLRLTRDSSTRWKGDGGTSIITRYFTLQVGTVGNNTYNVVKMVTSGTIINIYSICRSGTCTATTSIAGGAVTATANAVSTANNAQGVTAANTFVRGNLITTAGTANSSCLDMNLTYEYLERQ